MYVDWLPPKHHYFWFRKELDGLGTKMLCFGFWWFHIYYDTGQPG